jgi:hypothetical protein
LENNTQDELYDDNSDGNGNGKNPFGADSNPRNNNKCETLEDGIFAFMHWLNSEDKKSLSGEDSIVLMRFMNDRHTILYDTTLHTQLEVQINNGIPFCKYCNQDDCAHVGFAIEVEQFFGHRRGGGAEQNAEDLLEI